MIKAKPKPSPSQQEPKSPNDNVTVENHPGSSTDTRSDANKNVILVPKKLILDPGWDRFVKDYGTSVDDTTMKSRTPGTLVRIQKPIPNLPSKQEILKHNVTHIPHKQWCVHCVEGRMVKDHSLTVPKEERLERKGVIVQLDFFEFHGCRVLAMVEIDEWIHVCQNRSRENFYGHLRPQSTNSYRFFR